jgi:hypothetical protein
MLSEIEESDVELQTLIDEDGNGENIEEHANPKEDLENDDAEPIFISGEQREDRIFGSEPEITKMRFTNFIVRFPILTTLIFLLIPVSNLPEMRFMVFLVFCFRTSFHTFCTF